MENLRALVYEQNMQEQELITLALEKVQKPSKLTGEQAEHFKKKGKFSAIYKPYTTHDIDNDLRIQNGRKVIIYCNYETVPCIDAPKFFGQYKFFIEDLESRGWCPEMEFEDIKIINDFADCNVWNCDHQYLTVIGDRKVAKKELGKYGETCEIPLVLGRVYGTQNHEYVKSLAKFDVVLYKYKDEEWKQI